MKLSAKQFDLIETAKRVDFYEELAAFFNNEEPALFATLSDDEQLAFARGCHVRCEAAGLTSTAAIYAWADLSILLGSQFDRDPYFTFVIDELRRSSAFTEEDHVGAVQDTLTKYLAQVRGTNAKALKASFALLRDFVLSPEERARYDATHWRDLESEQMRLARMIYPEVVAFHGDETTILRLQHFMHQGRRNYGIETPWGLSYYTQLGMAFGIGMDRDELFPWISRTLARSTALGAEQMMEQMGAKSRTWFTHILDDDA